ncbi:MAG: chemotaxis protein CheW [Treponema sp.]|nr:chemotaxis protein CheW [Treponema sp.]
MTIDSILVADDSEGTAVVSIANDSEVDESRKQQATIDFKMVTFSLSGKDYAIDIMYVKEIAKAGHFTFVPNVLPFVVGVYNLRGEIIPILDLRLFFNIDVVKKSRSALENLLILTVGEQTFGIIVDKIDKVVGVQKSSIQPPHALFSDVNVNYISGVVESNKRLYILLDIERIFSKETIENNQQNIQPVKAANVNVKLSKVSSATASTSSVKVEKPVEKAPVVAAAPKENKEDEQNFKFIVESLKNYKKYNVSEVNEGWVRHRFEEWKKERSKDKVQIQSDSDATLFLQSFWSTCTDSWWTKEFADAVYNLLPDNSAKQIVVWNPGCGKGTETYCLACVLAKRYPSSKIRIYAQDIDLLNVSNAPLLAVPAKEASGWLSPYLTKNASGKDTFTKEIKDSIMFEYHDCLHTNALPMTDIIFARDLLSFIDVSVLKNVITDFEEKLKGNGCLIIGENEEIEKFSDFIENSVGSLTAYKKQ